MIATSVWEPHRFPEKKITRRVVRARKPYRCETQGPTAEGHTPRIIAGEQYLKLGLRPMDGGSSGFRTRHICAACAIDFELAKEGSK